MIGNVVLDVVQGVSHEDSFNDSYYMPQDDIP